MLKLLEGEAHLAALKVKLADEQIGTIHVFMGAHGIPIADSDDDEVIYPPITSDRSSSDSHSHKSPHSDTLGSIITVTPTPTPLTTAALKCHKQMVDSEPQVVKAL